jgi:Tol biopolymer transport system component
MAWGLGSRALIIRDLESGAERELKPDMTFFIRPRWSPDGRTILLKGSTGEQKRGLHEFDVADGSLRTVFYREHFGGFEWSKDGTAIFYERDSELVRREIATEREEVVYRAVAPWTLSGMSLSPDGRWLALVNAVSSADGWTQVLTLMPSSGGATRELPRVQKPETIALGSWTSAGDAVHFVRSSEPELWRAPVALGPPEPLSLKAEGLREVRVHPDGRRIAFTSGWPDYSLWVLERFLPEGS